MSDKLTVAQIQKDYLEAGGVRCPFCKSHDIEAGRFDGGEDGTAWQDVICHGCTAEWKDVYKLDRIETIEGLPFGEPEKEVA